jgi:8-oxo-dGTP diphosphatase
METAYSTVAAAVMVRDGRVLCCRRRNGMFSGKWEFPGGKTARNESTRDALHREIREELSVDVVIGRPIATVSHRYENGPDVVVEFFSVESSGEPTGDEYEEMIWASPDEMRLLDWLEADVAVAELIARRIEASKRKIETKER